MQSFESYISDFKCKIRSINNKRVIFDKIRKRYVKFTPEELVRQYIIHLLSTNYKYPAGMIHVEHLFTHNQVQYRPDIVIFTKYQNIFMIVECKAPRIKINSTVLEQILRYNTPLNAQFLMVANGVDLLCWERICVNNCYDYARIAQLPNYM